LAESLPRRGLLGRWLILRSFMMLASLLVISSAKTAVWGQEAVPTEEQSTEDPFESVANEEPLRSAWRVTVDLPLMGADDESLLRRLQEIADQPAQGERPVVLLEFRRKSGAASEEALLQDAPRPAMGVGTSFERSLSVARWLTSAEGTRLRTVAYLSEALQGHALLVALACEDLAMASAASLGPVYSLGKPEDATVRQAYQEILQLRPRFPEPMLATLLDPGAELIRLQMADGRRLFVDRPEAQRLLSEGQVTQQEEMLSAGQRPDYSGRMLRKEQWIDWLSRDRQSLLESLGASPIVQEPVWHRGPWKPLRLQLIGQVHHRQVNQLIRALEEGIRREQANVAILEIDSPGGDMAESLRLASHLAGLDPKKVQTFAYIRGEAGADASLVAMSCQRIAMGQEATLGGPGPEGTKIPEWEEIGGALQLLETQTQRPAMLLHALAASRDQLISWQGPDGQKVWSAADPSIGDPDSGPWIQDQVLDTRKGLAADVAKARGWIHQVENDLASAVKKLGIEELPEPKRSSAAELFVERLAAQSWLPPLLISIGFMTLMMELSAPGLGVAGFISACCFIGFFWIRFLNGTVEWLEVLLFLVGMLFLALELLVLPGFGIFGVGGLAMVIASLILASQTFILPTTPSQVNQVAWNTGQVALAIAGIFVGLFLIRDRIDQLPWFRWFKLKPAGVDDPELLEEREAVVRWEHLQGKTGLTTTRLNPSGKAQIGDQLVNVISTSEMLGPQERVRVVRVLGNSVWVERL
jgi:membrane-bound ClpP family serine protease